MEMQPLLQFRDIVDLLPLPRSSCLLTDTCSTCSTCTRVLEQYCIPFLDCESLGSSSKLLAFLHPCALGRDGTMS